ncbi:MAG: glycosyltransferase family 9 protein [Solirubrobacteraceae bacterium]
MSRRVLIARQDSLGDVLLAGPAVRAVAASRAAVTLLCGPRGRAAAELLPGVAEVLEWRADWIDADPQALHPAHVNRLVELIRGRRFHEALILTSHHQSPLPLALLLRMADVSHVAAISPDYPGTLLDVRHRVASDIHEVERALSLMAACGYEPPDGDDLRLRLRGVGTPHPAVEAMKPYVVVHPGASVSARAWPQERYVELLELLVERGGNVVVTGALAEAGLTARICGRPDPRIVDLGGLTDLRGLAATIAGAQAIVVANTGPAHLAAAVGTPVVSIYAPTVPSVRWRPWGVPTRLLERDVACAGCRARTCPVPDHPCMQEISAAEVVQALGELASPAWRQPVAGAPPHASHAHEAVVLTLPRPPREEEEAVGA